MSLDIDNAWQINENVSSDWVDIFDNGDLCRRVLTASETCDDDRKPKNGDKVEIRVVGRLNDGKVVDDFSKISFTLGLSDVIQAWELAVAFMTVGEVNEIKTTSRFAYGDTGRAPDIPQEAQITYEIELISIANGDDLNQMSVQERLAYGSARKERGNYYFNREEFSQAIEVYQKGIKSLTPREDDDVKDQKEMMAKAAILYNNLAAAQLKISAWKAVVDSTNSCLLIEPRNAKALYRRAKALLRLKHVEKALEDFEIVRKIDPKCPGVKEEISLCKKLLKDERQEEKLLYRKMAKVFEENNNNSPSKFQSKYYQNFLKSSKILLISGVVLASTYIFSRFFAQASIH